MTESYLYPFLGFEPDPARYEQSHVLPGDSYDVIASLIGMGSSVLEIGCGTGSLLQFLAKSRSCLVDGIEPNEDRANLAKAKGLSVIHSYLTAETFLPRSCYDYIILADVLEHLDDPSTLLIESKRLLKDGGFYIISVPNMIHWSVRLRLLSGVLEYQQSGLLDATHLRWFTNISILAYLERLNFKVVNVKHTIGSTLSCYSNIPIFSGLRESARIKILRRLTRVYPSLFACQNVVLARPVVVG